MTYDGVTQNPYDSAVQDPETGTVPIDEAIRMAIRQALLSARFCLPGMVTKVLGNQKANVQPTLQTRYVDNKLVNLPELQNVPVGMPMGASYSIKLPFAVGDTGTLFFSDRAIDAWLAGSGGIVDPADSRIHDYNDAVFVPGLVPFSNQTQDSTTDLVITNGKAVGKFQAAGTFTFGNGKNEMMDLIDQLMANVDTLYTILTTETFTLTMLGPQPFIGATVQALNQAKTTLDTIKSNWETLKGST